MKLLDLLYDRLGSAAAAIASSLQKNNNLSDLTNVSAARGYLGLGSAATQNSSAFATAAQGTKADGALRFDVSQTLTSPQKETIRLNIGGAKHNLTAGALPTLNDDVNQGYSKGSLWLYNENFYICVDETSTAAYWKLTTLSAEEVASLISDAVSNLVPFTGATSNLVFGSNSIDFDSGFGLTWEDVGYGAYLNTGGETPDSFVEVGGVDLFNVNVPILETNGSICVGTQIMGGPSYDPQALTIGYGIRSSSGDPLALPDGPGTLALVEDLSAYVPYTGASAELDLGLQDLRTGGYIVDYMGGNAVDVPNRRLLAGDGLTQMLDWSDPFTNGFVYFSGGIAVDAGGSGPFLTPNGLMDASLLSSVDPITRRLYSADGTTRSARWDESGVKFDDGLGISWPDIGAGAYITGNDSNGSIDIGNADKVRLFAPLCNNSGYYGATLTDPAAFPFGADLMSNSVINIYYLSAPSGSPCYLPSAGGNLMTDSGYYPYVSVGSAYNADYAASLSASVGCNLNGYDLDGIYSLKNTTNQEFLNGDARTLYDYLGAYSVLWSNRILADATGYDGLNWDDRQLLASDGTTVLLDWTNPSFTTTAKPFRLEPIPIGSLPSGADKEGCVAYVNDADTPVVGSVVAGGASDKCTVQHNGTDWIVIAIL